MNATTPLDDERYEILRRRDPSATGFFSGVLTTKIYCRPSCSAKTPLRKNVAFFETSQAAERAGFRACKRCRPELENVREALAERIEEACRRLDAADQSIALAELAARAGVSAFHFQRAFKKHVGVSPKQYALALRERRLRTSLASSPTITEAALDAGFSSLGAMYETRGVARSMTPRAYRNGGRGERIAYALAQTSLGWLLLARTGRGICRLDLDETRPSLIERLQTHFGAAILIEDEPMLEDDLASAVALVEGERSSHDLPLDVRGTSFQHRVWKTLQAIPAGETRTYREIAQALGQPSAVRAVAGACAANALAVAIPCHRAVRADGTLGGYRWGIQRKRVLLTRERTTKPTAT